jgi:hypothetical protein
MQAVEQTHGLFFKFINFIFTFSGSLLGCCCRQRFHATGRVDIEHQLVNQLFGFAVEKELAKRACIVH